MGGGGGGGGGTKWRQGPGHESSNTKDRGEGSGGEKHPRNREEKKKKIQQDGGGGRRSKKKEKNGGGLGQGARKRRTQKHKGGGVGATAERPGPGHPGPGSTESRRQRGPGWGGGKGRRITKEEKKNTQSTGNPSPMGAEQSRRTRRPQEKVRRTGTRPGGQPARPGQEKHAHTRARDPGVASSDPKGDVLPSTRNTPGAPAESPVITRTVWETGNVSDRVHTRQTTAAHTAQDQNRRDPPGTTPSRGPERVRRGARPAPVPRQGPAAGTKSPVLGRPPRAPRGHPVRPEATAPGVGEGTMATGK